MENEQNITTPAQAAGVPEAVEQAADLPELVEQSANTPSDVALADDISAAVAPADDIPAEAAPASSASADAPAMPKVGVVLASGSPRRRELLERERVPFVVRVSDVDESLEPDQLADPPEAAKQLAQRKAAAVMQEMLSEKYVGMAAVVGADTMVVCGGEIFGKPVSLSDAKRMLRRLQGTTHQVVTAVSVWLVSAPTSEDVSLGFRTFADTANVTFRSLTDQQIDDYLRKGESFDKAGAYAAQGEGAKLVERIDGDRDTVIGLPVKRLLREFPDIIVPESE